MRDFYLILNSTVALALVALGVAVFLNNKKDRMNRLFLAFTVSVAIWVVAACVSNDVRLGENVSLYGNYLVFLLSYFSSFFLLWFVVRLVSAESLVRWLKWLSPIIILIGLLSATPLVVAGVTPQEHVYAVEFGVLTPLYGALLLGQLALAIGILAIKLRHAEGRRHQQIRVILKALTIAIPILVITQFVAPALTGSFEITDSGILIMILPVVALYMSVVRHGLFDIRLATVRTVGYVLTVATMAGIYVLFAYLLSIVLFSGNITDGVGLSPVNIATALVLAFIFQPIKHFFDRWTNNIFYRGSYNQENFVRELGQMMSHTTVLSQLLRQIGVHLGSTLGAEGVFFYINNRGVLGRYNTKRSRMPESDILSINAWFVSQDNTGDAVLFRDNMDEELQRLLDSHGVQIVMRLVVGRQVLGYLLIGEHKGRGYTARDIRTLSMINNELAIAMQNALSVEEVRDLNRTLEQRIARATKDLRESNRQLKRLDEAKTEFVSMASHQLRTPLTSIKGYLDMILQGDMGTVNATQQAALSEAFLSSERMVALINDFLNVSRLQTGRFVIDRSTSDLKEAVRDQVSMLQVIAKQHGLTIEAKIDDEVPVMEIDIDKLRQVVLNFIDNAIYYSKAGAKIYVSLTKERRQVVLTVKDTGIGVPESEKSQLFGRFFRAENARLRRPDGTGVGLFLAKKIVLLHGGQIIFESEEGKGSTFGFRLPIASQKQSAKQEA